MTARPANGNHRPGGKFEVRTLVRADEFAALRADWNALLRGRQRDEVFLTHEWFDAAWQWRQQTADLFVLCLFYRDRLAAALPLVRAKRGGARGRELDFLTVPDTQFCDIVASDEHRAEAVTAFVDELILRRDDWDVLRLGYLREDAIAANELARAFTGLRIACRVSFATGNAYIPLDATWDAYYATRSRSLKKANNLCANRIAKAGEVRVNWLAPGTGDASAADRFVDDVIGISARSWKTRTENSLDNPGPQAFIRRLSHLAHGSGWLSVWVLALDGDPVAMEYQLIADGNVYALRSDFDASREEISPGSHLNRVLLERLFGRSLHRYYMGPGDNPYKFRWTDNADPVGTLVAFSPSVRGRVLAAWQLGIKPVLRRLREPFRTSRPGDNAAHGGAR